MLSWENYWPDLLRERIKEAGAGGRNIHVWRHGRQHIYAFSLTAARWPGKQQWWMTRTSIDLWPAAGYDRQDGCVAKKTGMQGERIEFSCITGRNFVCHIWPPIKSRWRFLSGKVSEAGNPVFSWRKQMLQPICEEKFGTWFENLEHVTCYCNESGLILIGLDAPWFGG